MRLATTLCIGGGNTGFAVLHGFCILRMIAAVVERMGRAGGAIRHPLPDGVLDGALGSNPMENSRLPTIAAAMIAYPSCSNEIFWKEPLTKVQRIASVLALVIGNRHHGLPVYQIRGIDISQTFLHHAFGHGSKVNVVDLLAHDAVGMQIPFYGIVRGQDGVFEVARNLGAFSLEAISR